MVQLGLTLVAVAKSAAVKPRLMLHGSRVIVSSEGFTAFADGDEPLKAGDPHLPPEPKPVTHDPEKESVIVVGAHPSFFAFRRNNLPCGRIDEPALFVYEGGSWRPKKITRDPVPPYAFGAWKNGALFVDSQIPACGWATSSVDGELQAGPGTKLTFVSKDGTLSHPTLGLDPDFIAWDASTKVTATDSTLALVGTYGAHGDPGPGRSTPGVPHDIVVMRRHAEGAFKASIIVHGVGSPMGSLRTYVQELGSAAIVVPPPAHDDGTAFTNAPAEGGDEPAWTDHASSIFVITDEKTRELRFRAPNEECTVDQATLVGQTVYALVACPKLPLRFIRFAADGTRERIAPPALPAFPGDVCRPRSLIVRQPDDLWVRAECGNEGKAVVAFFRAGHEQEPITLP